MIFIEIKQSKLKKTVKQCLWLHATWHPKGGAVILIMSLQPVFTVCCCCVPVRDIKRSVLSFLYRPHGELTCWQAALGPPAWRPSQRWAPEARRQPPPWTTGRRALRPPHGDMSLLSPAGRSASRPSPPSTGRRAAASTGTSRLGSIRETQIEAITALCNTRGMQLLLISTVTTVAVFKPAVVIATVYCRVTSAVLCLSCDRYEQLTSSDGCNTCLCLCIHLFPWQHIPHCR